MFNLVTNGNFASWTGDNPDDWTVVGESGNDPEISEAATGEAHADTPTPGGGMCNIYTTSATVQIIQFTSQFPTVVEGRKYRFSIKIDTVTSGSLYVREFYGAFANQIIDASGTYTWTFVAAADLSIRIISFATPCDITFDDVSIVELGPLSDALLTISASNTILNIE